MSVYTSITHIMKSEREIGGTHQDDDLVRRLEHATHPGPEQCSLAWVLMNEFLDTR
jgi:hypothetical protein